MYNLKMALAIGIISRTVLVVNGEERAFTLGNMAKILL